MDWNDQTHSENEEEGGEGVKNMLPEQAVFLFLSFSVLLLTPSVRSVGQCFERKSFQTERGEQEIPEGMPRCFEIMSLARL